MATLEENLIPVELKRSGSVDEMGKLSCTAVRFGEYNVVPSSTRDEITIKVSKKGFEIDLSCTDYYENKTELMIPLKGIKMIKALVEHSLQMFFILVGPNQATAIKTALSLDENKSGPKFCPLNGTSPQRLIVFYSYKNVDSNLKKIITDSFSSVITEITLEEAVEEYMLTTSSYDSMSNDSRNLETQNVSDVILAYSTETPEVSQTLMAIQDNQTPKKVDSVKQDPASEQEVISAKSAKIQRYLEQGIILAYPGRRGGETFIGIEDIKKLKYPLYLNDIHIDFWLDYILTEKTPETIINRVYVYDTYFYSSLVKPNGYALVQKRTRKLDIFTKDFLLIPVNQNKHWFLVVVCFPGSHQNNHFQAEPDQMPFPNESRKNTNFCGIEDSVGNTVILPESRIVILDSRPGLVDPTAVFSMIRGYLNQKLRDIEKTESFNEATCPGIRPIYPIQQNLSDCGLFLLQNFEKILSNPDHFYENMFQLESWYDSRLISLYKRKEIYEHIYKKVLDKSQHLDAFFPKLNFDMKEEDLIDKKTWPPLEIFIDLFCKLPVDS